MPRRHRLIAMAAVLVVITGVTAAVTASASSERPEDLCARYQTTTVKNGRYTVQNNVWGATTDQCVRVFSSDGSFHVISSAHRNTETAAAYPSIYAGCHWGNCTRGSDLPVRVDRLRAARSTWRTVTGAPGAWAATYDLWFHTSAEINQSPDGAELQIWLDHAGGIDPGGRIIARDVELAGARWDVWSDDLAWNFIAYVRRSPVSDVRHLDLKAFTLDAVARGHIGPSWYLSGVEAGFELWRDGTGLGTESFSVAIEDDGSPDARPPAVGTADPPADGSAPVLSSAPPPPGLGATPPASGPPAPASASPAPPGGVSAPPAPGGRPPAAGEPPAPEPSQPPDGPQGDPPPPDPHDPPADPAAPRCSVRWSADVWRTGMLASVVVTNHGPAVRGWTVTWVFPARERLTGDWGAEITQAGQRARARNAPYNAGIDSGASQTFGFQATHDGVTRPPTEFQLNGTTCAVTAGR